MFFGAGKNIGNPPPLVFLNGYGRHYFPNVPCVITNFSHSMPGEVDYIETGLTGGVTESTKIPTASKISVNLQPVYSKGRIAEFNLQDFSQGRLVDRGFL
jgi:hypothetical protein